MKMALYASKLQALDPLTLLSAHILKKLNSLEENI